MEVTHADAEGEVVIALDDAEAEIIPLQRGWCRRYGVLPLTRRHFAVFGGNRLDIGWLADRMPNGVSSPREFELISVRVVSAQMCAEDVGHRADIAPTISNAATTTRDMPRPRAF